MCDIIYKTKTTVCFQMSCCLPSEDPNTVVIIKGGKYDGELAVLQIKHTKTWSMRLLDMERPFMERFGYGKSKAAVLKAAAKKRS